MTGACGYGEEPSGSKNVILIQCNFIFVNMPHHIHKCTNTLYDYAIINY